MRLALVTEGLIHRSLDGLMDWLDEHAPEVRALEVGTGGYSPLGIVGGMVPPLARPLPLDYASMGPAGAMLGYWVSRSWHLEREHDPETEEEVEEALEHPKR